MKVCIVGAGAVGGLIGAKLALAGGCELSALARGATLAALRTKGWRLRSGDAFESAPAMASDDPAGLGPQDVVIIAVKGPALTDVARRIAPLLGPDTIVVPAMNGVPWWFHDRLESVDPGGVIAEAIPLERVVGCVVHVSALTSEPGLVEHQRGLGLIIGEAVRQEDEPVTPRVRSLGDLLLSAGFEVTLADDVRKDIWYKLWGNLSTNPVSAFTGATADRIVDDPLVSAFCISVMTEAAEVGARIGCALAQTPRERHEITRKIGVFKTSMLQDAEAGRPLELDAIVGAVRELGQRVGVPTPYIDALFGLARLYGRVHGLYPEAAAS